MRCRGRELGPDLFAPIGRQHEAVLRPRLPAREYNALAVASSGQAGRITIHRPTVWLSCSRQLSTATNSFCAPDGPPDFTLDRLRKRIFDTEFREQRKVAIAGEQRVDAVRDADGGNTRVMHHGSAHTRATHEARQYAGEPLRLAE